MGRAAFQDRGWRWIRQGAGAAGLVALASLLAVAAGERLSPVNVAMLLLLSVLVSGAALGMAPALAAAGMAGLIYNFFFLEPHYTLRIEHPEDLLTFFAFLAVALATGWLLGRARDNARRAELHAARLATLLGASRALASATGPNDAAQSLAEQLGAASGGSAVVLLPGDGGLYVAGAPPALNALGASGMQAAQAAWTGRAADDAETEWTFVLLEGVGSRVGVAGFRAPPRLSGGDDADVAGALLRQGGVAIERAVLAMAASENEALRQADKLRTGLLNSISHDFRTPLASILGSATTLADYGDDLRPAVRGDLLRSIQEDAERLNRHIGALLDMGRLEGGALRPRAEWTDVRELVGSALRRLRPVIAGRRVERDFAERLSLVRADPTLLEQAILNILDNAAKHTDARSPIRIAAHEDTKNVLLSIDDEGPGIPEADLGAVFDKFRRLGGDRESGAGLGLGLSIARGFVEAMGGRLAAASPIADGRGARFVISLPKTIETPRGLL